MNDLHETLTEKFGQTAVAQAFKEITLTVKCDDVITACQYLKFKCEFEILIDLCGVDYLSYGQSEWQTNSSSGTGFSRARFDLDDNHSELTTSAVFKPSDEHPQRFCVVYHLLSLANNYRLRVKTYVNEDDLFIDSVTKIWSSADWYEREAFDLFGILFKGHEDLRRILTDYGFIGHPLRKDFPMIGEVEMRYDEKTGKVIYEPVSIEPQINTPKVIR